MKTGRIPNKCVKRKGVMEELGGRMLRQSKTNQQFDVASRHFSLIAVQNCGPQFGPSFELGVNVRG